MMQHYLTILHTLSENPKSYYNITEVSTSKNSKVWSLKYPNIVINPSAIEYYYEKYIGENNHFVQTRDKPILTIKQRSPKEPVQYIYINKNNEYNSYEEYLMSTLE